MAKNDVAMPVEAMAHQLDGIAWLRAQGCGILADEPGLGKTLQACVAAVPPVLVVCVAAMRTDWQREMARWRPDLSTTIITGRTEREQAVYTAAQVVIVNYDVLDAHGKALAKVGFETIVTDEAQAIKTLKQTKRGYAGSARARAFVRLALTVPRRFVLTATPVMNRTIELWPLLHVVDPERWQSYSDFGVSYCAGFLETIYRKPFPLRSGDRVRDQKGVEREVGWCDVSKGRLGLKTDVPRRLEFVSIHDVKPLPRKITAWNFKGSSNRAELHEELTSRYMLRRGKDVLDLPPKSRATKLVTLQSDAARTYLEAEADFKRFVLDRGGVEALERHERAEVVTRMTALRRLAAVGKVDYAARWCCEHAQATTRPLVVMAHHRDVTVALRAQLAAAEIDSPGGKRPLRVGAIVGGMGEQSRRRDKDAFQAGELDVLVCSISAAGVGLTLTAASEMLFVERSWRPMDLVQAEDRIWRIGQPNKCSILYLDAPGTIDDAMASMLVDKVATIAGVVDGLDLPEDEAQRHVLGSLLGTPTRPRKPCRPRPPSQQLKLDWQIPPW